MLPVLVEGDVLVHVVNNILHQVLPVLVEGDRCAGARSQQYITSYALRSYRRGCAGARSPQTC